VAEGAGAVLDLRLVPVALAAWGVTAAGLFMPPRITFVGAAVCAAAAGGAFLVRRRWAAGAAAVLVLAAAVALSIGLRVAARDSSPLAQLADRDAVATVDLVVGDDPRVLAAGPGGRARVLVPVTATAVRAAGRSWRVRDDLIVLADAAAWGRLLPGQRLTGTGVLLPARGGDLTAAALAARGPPDLSGAPSPLQRAAGALRAGLVRAVGVLPDGPRGLLPGLVVGDITGMDPVLIEQFRTTGLTHLVAVSGANCAIVVGAVLWLLRRVGLPRLALVVVAGLALAGFVVLVRPSPSVVRAAAMGALALLALATGRPRAAIPALSATVLVLVLLSPTLAWSAGFALSVCATAGIVVAGPGVTKWLRARRVPAGVAEALAVSVAAAVATAPLIAALSSAVSLVAVPANVLAAPAVPPATVLGVLATLLGPLSPAAASGCALLAGLPARWIVWLAERGSALPNARLPWPGGLAGALLLTGLLLAGLVLGRRLPRFRRLGLAVACGVLLIGTPLRGLVPGWPPPGWLFLACDVGQGDALLLSAGPVDGCLRDAGVDRVPLLILSHLHADHVGGLAGVLRGRDVGAIEVGPQPELGPAWAQVQDAAAAAGIPVLQSVVGEIRSVAEVSVEVLAPQVAEHGTRSDPNNSSLVVAVRTSGITILCSGDIEIEGQRSLLREHPDIRADVLKVPHHGSSYQDERFLDGVHARLAIISVGAGNDYGHPSAALIQTLRGLGMHVVRTDVDGAVAVGVDQDSRLWVAVRARGSPAA